MSSEIPPAGVIFTGRAGAATQVRVPNLPGTAASRIAFLIDAPWAHPLWRQYLLSVVSLAPHDGLPPAVLKFPGATHELIVFALQAADGPHPTYSHTQITEHIANGTLPFLTPVNIAEQFQATDDEMRHLAHLCAWGVINAHLNPETADAPDRIRMDWLAACTKTLAHIRGEAHAR